MTVQLFDASLTYREGAFLEQNSCAIYTGPRSIAAWSDHSEPSLFCLYDGREDPVLDRVFECAPRVIRATFFISSGEQYHLTQ